MTDDAPSPQETRARLERSYEDSYRKLGRPTEGLKDLARADLELVDAARRIGELDERPVVRDEIDGRPKPKEIADAEAETGARLLDEDDHGETVSFGVMDEGMLFSGERWGLAGGRIRRILEGSGGSKDVKIAVENATLPKLAREYIETWWNFTRRDRFPVRETKNPFDGMSDKDACRMLVRKVEDICDRSSGSMGPWFVPK